MAPALRLRGDTLDEDRGGSRRGTRDLVEREELREWDWRLPPGIPASRIRWAMGASEPGLAPPVAARLSRSRPARLQHQSTHVAGGGSFLRHARCELLSFANAQFLVDAARGLARAPASDGNEHALKT